ncbi:MAG: FAD-dependent oxidoreductase, partial [Ferrovibrionaceae bacterium]
MRRLAEGGRIDRSQVLNFYFDQRRLQGFAGDTLASALLANGVSIVGRSFKYHRPRGIMAAGPEEPNALVTLGDGALAEPNLRATDIPLQDGLYATSQNRWPSLGFDVGATADMLSRFLPAGFYYKTFMWPGWRYFEPHIRRAAGLGPAPTTVEPDPERYLRRYHHCDVLVIGAGPAGLAAARAAASAGLDVTLVERDVEPGGSLLWRGGTVDGMDADGFIAGLPPLRLLTRATAIGYYDHNAVTVLEHLPPGGPARQRLWQIRARQVVLATGAIERHLVFPNNDRPGVMLADATLHYLRRHAVACGQRAIFVTNNDTAYDAALALAEAGVEIAAVADVRRGADGDAPRRARERGLKVLDGVTALATTGRGRVSA